MKVGDRVATYNPVKDGNGMKIIVFGEGVYDGEHTHPQIGSPNPRIKLDNGKTIWGCQCWWGHVDQIKGKIEEFRKAGYTIEEHVWKTRTEKPKLTLIETPPGSPGH